eukprot:354670-Chlamydomonas_euryale.AAC.1
MEMRRCHRPLSGQGGAIYTPNYRGIALLSLIAKPYTHIMRRRRLRLMNPSLSPTQFGFRPRRGTADAMFILPRVQEESLCSHATLYVAYVDLSKAFNRVNHEALWQTLLHRGVPTGLADRIKSMCTGATACARCTSKMPHGAASRQHLHRHCHPLFARHPPGRLRHEHWMYSAALLKEGGEAVPPS